MDRPPPEEIVGLLTLKSHGCDLNDDGIEALDFTLSENVTDYVLCVRFDTDEDVSDIAMES